MFPGIAERFFGRRVQKMRKTIFLILLIIPSSVFAVEFFQPLDKQDIILQSVLTGMICVDWMQTKSFRALNRRESNSILGERPSQDKIDTLIFAGIISHALVTYFLPKKHRIRWQYFLMKNEKEAIDYNHSAGFVLSF